MWNKFTVNSYNDVDNNLTHTYVSRWLISVCAVFEQVTMVWVQLLGVPNNMSRLLVPMLEVDINIVLYNLLLLRITTLSQDINVCITYLFMEILWY